VSNEFDYPILILYITASLLERDKKSICVTSVILYVILTIGAYSYAKIREKLS